MLEIQSKKPIPVDEKYLERKGFDFKKRKLTLTLGMLQKFLISVTDDSDTLLQTFEKSVAKGCNTEESRVDKIREEERENDVTPILTFGKHVKISTAGLDRLETRFGKSTVSSCIERMNDYISAKNKKPYSDYEAALRNWLSRDSEKKEVKF